MNILIKTENIYITGTIAEQIFTLTVAQCTYKSRLSFMYINFEYLHNIKSDDNRKYIYTSSLRSKSKLTTELIATVERS